MTVTEVKPGMMIIPDHVYIIPPGKYIIVAENSFDVPAHGDFEKTIRTIDFFFESIAGGYQSKAIGIILTGTETEGTVGLQSIKAEGGITLAQSETAMLNGTMHNAFESGYIDFVLSTQEIVKELSRHCCT
jgi:two-component system CheB/CheR fusion protein